MLRFLYFLSWLPEFVLFFLSGVFGWLLFHVFRYRRKTVRSNLAKAFPDKTVAERAELEREYYRYLADLVVEILLLSRLTPQQLLQRVEVIGLEHLQRCKEANTSAILLSAHQGNWEWMLAAVACISPLPLAALYRPLHQSRMDEFFMAVRTRFKAEMIPAEQAARVIFKLRREPHAFGILGDQNPRRNDEKYWAPFMGIDTPVVIGPERIARLTGYPLFYVATERLARGHYRCVIKPLLSTPYDKLPDGEISRIYMEAVETHVQSQPACWMWSHQRWRYRREDTPQYKKGQC